MVESKAENGNSVVGGFIWKLAERVLAQGITFSVSIVLARLLLPADYGVISIVLIFIAFADVLVSNGFSTALIQKKDADETDFSTMLYCSLFVSLIIYALMFLAPMIAAFYDNPILVPVIRVFCLRLPISSLNSVQHAYVSRNMLFRKFFYSTLGGTLLSGVVGIGMAYKGFGVWAIVGQYLTNTIVDSVVLLLTIKWHPRLLFSMNSAKKMMSYGWKVTATSLSGTFFNQLRSLIIGKIYTASDLAFYERGRNFSTLATENIGMSLMAVLFPKFANSSSDLWQVKSQLRKAIQIITYVLFPMTFGMALVARPMVLILLTDKWIECVPYIQILSVSAAVALVGDVSLQAISAIGKSDVTLKLEVVKKPVFLLLLVIGVNISVKAVAITMLINSVYASLSNVSVLNKYLSYSFGELIRDVLPAVVLTAIMGSLIMIITTFQFAPIWLLIVQVLLGIFVYIVLSIITHNSSYLYIVNYLKGILRR